jgi:hypothetical protein
VEGLLSRGWKFGAMGFNWLLIFLHAPLTTSMEAAAAFTLLCSV